MVFNWPSPSSTDSDTESVANTGSCPFFPRTVLSAPFSQAITDSDTRSGGMGEKAEKRKSKLGLNSDQLGRNAMTGLPASRETLVKNPEVKRDALVGSENGKPLAVNGGSGGADEPPAMAKAGEVITPYLKMYTLAELKRVTRNFRPETMLGEVGFGRLYRGWVDERTLAPSRVGSGIRVVVKKYNPEGLGEWQHAQNTQSKLVDTSTQSAILLLHSEAHPFALSHEAGSAIALLFHKRAPDVFIYRSHRPSCRLQLVKEGKSPTQ